MSLNFGTFAVPSKNATAGTVWSRGVDPWAGAGSAHNLYAINNGNPNWAVGQKVRTHLTEILVDCGSTANGVYVLRPLNYSVIAAATAKAGTTITLTDDPGVYSTNYKYKTPGGVAPCSVADNGISANDYVAYQLADGTWVYDTVSSVAGFVLTMTTAVPSPTGTGGVLAGSILFFFGIQTDVDPATGQAHPLFTPTASTKTNVLGVTAPRGLSAVHGGDPMILYCGNATARTDLASAAGEYLQF